MNTNYSTVLINEAMLQFAAISAPINAFSYATSNESLNVNDIIKVPIQTTFSASSDFNYGTAYGNDSTNLSVIPVTLNRVLTQKFSINDADYAKLDAKSITAFAGAAGAKLGADVVSASLATVINDTNYPTSASVTFTQLTSSIALADLNLQCDNGNFPMVGRNLILNPTGFNALIKNTSLNVAYAYNPSIVTNALPEKVYGFNVFKTSVLPNSCKGLVLNPNAVLFASGKHAISDNSKGYVAQDSLTVNGITITMKSFYDALNAKSVYILECLFGVAVGNTTSLYQMK